MYAKEEKTKSHIGL